MANILELGLSSFHERLERDVVLEQRVDAFAGEARPLDRERQTVYRGITDSERQELAIDMAYLTERLLRLPGEKKRLRQTLAEILATYKLKFQELDAAIDREIVDSEREISRLMAAIRYGEIAETVTAEQAVAASAPTGLLTPSQELAAQQKQKPGR